MLVVKVLRSDDRCVIKLAGPLTGSWTEDLRCALVRTSILEVDLRDVTFVDDKAEKELSLLRRMGATFQGEGRFVKRTWCGYGYKVFFAWLARPSAGKPPDRRRYDCRWLAHSILKQHPRTPPKIDISVTKSQILTQPAQTS